MGTKFDLSKIPDWGSTTHQQVADILGCSYHHALRLRADMGMPKGTRQKGSGTNRKILSKPKLPWHIVTNWTAPPKEIAVIVGGTVEAVKFHIKRHRNGK